jgi:hypothetical protein
MAVRVTIAAASALVLLLAAAAPPASAQNHGGLSAKQMAALRRLPFTAVVPDSVPAGFRLYSFRIAPRKYMLTYYRPQDRAVLVFAGKAAAPGTSAQQLAQEWSTEFQRTATTAYEHQGSLGELEAHETSMDHIPNDDIGPAGFRPSGNCFLGFNDPGQAERIHNAIFAAAGCGLNERTMDTLAQAYQDLVPVR